MPDFILERKVWSKPRDYVNIMERRTIFALHDGDVAQLARALDWQSRGRRFEPDLLHIESPSFSEGLFCYFNGMEILEF